MITPAWRIVGKLLEKPLKPSNGYGAYGRVFLNADVLVEAYKTLLTGPRRLALQAGGAFVIYIYTVLCLNLPHI